MTEQASTHEQPIYVGELVSLDLPFGVATEQYEIAQRAREVARQDITGAAIPAAIGRLAELIDPGSTTNEDLTTDQKNAVANAIAKLYGLHQRTTDNPNPRVITLRLYDLYFVDQLKLTNSAAGHILRQVGDTYAQQAGLDFEEFWELYQQSLEQVTGDYSY